MRPHELYPDEDDRCRYGEDETCPGIARENCEACNGRGYRDVTYEWRGSVQDGETGCSECCPHTELRLISGPGIACYDCGTWFKDRAAAEREVASR